jgi:O-methyltransferase
MQLLTRKKRGYNTCDTYERVIMKVKLIVVSLMFATPVAYSCAVPDITIGRNQFPPLIYNTLNTFASRAYSTRPTLYNSFEIAAFCIQNDIEGDFVECGVAGGAQVAAMAFASQCLKASREIHLFDSFQGIPLAGPNDDSQPGIGKITHNTNVANVNDLLVTSGVSSCSVAGVQANMRQWGIDQTHLKYHAGWFQYTLPKVASSIEKIAFLRLDGDLYESTKVCLEYLYPKMTSGGFVVIDDYCLTGCRKAVHEYIEKHNLQVTLLPVVNGGGPVFWIVE